MKKLILTTSIMLILVLNIFPVSAFITPKGNEITLIWDTRESRPIWNTTLQWIPRVDYPNGTTVYGHFERVNVNQYTIQIPYIAGITFNGIIYYRQFYTNKDDTDVSVFSVPIGDRNMEEYGSCREYEIRKGVCKNV